VRPSEAHISWSDAEDASGGVTYSVLIDGHVVMSGLHSLDALPPSRVLGSGVRHVQVLATDAAGQQTLSNQSNLKVDGSPPVAHVRRDRGSTVTVRVTDAQSGAVAGDTHISFGDGSTVNGKLTVRHVYANPGRYTIVVRMRDKVGNEGTAHLRVSVR
jgi:PKD domain-containing protein